jgi:hypothetical protein
MKIFEAQQNAGTIGIKDINGDVHELEISVFDYQLWSEYQASVAKAGNVKKEGLTDKQKEKLAIEEMEALFSQMQMVVPDIEKEMLKGISMMKVSDMLKYCVERASDTVDERTESEKKTTSGKHTKLSGLPGKASRSRRSRKAI